MANFGKAPRARRKRKGILVTTSSADRVCAEPSPASLRTPAGSPVKSSSLPRASFTPWLSVVLAVALFSNGLFGYDQGVISCALASISSAFTLSPLIVEVVTSWVLLGALLGALAVGERANGIGRKRSVLTAGILFTLGAAVRALALETMIQDIRE